ncbi:MAG TPA: C25 family cysteine peptidase [Candidatus Ozemobacteraceae bacterium]|nr:C25 family cysteine peptidase [Candidatus Ozemobacteraceae bacterium]
MKKFFVFFVMMVMLTGVVFAGELELKDAKGSGLKVISHKMGGQGEMTMRMSCSLDKLYFYDAETPKGSFTVMYSPEFFFGGEYGAPQLPVITKLIQIPFGANFRIEVKSYDTQEYNLADYGVSTRIFPRQPSAPKDGSEVPFIYEQSAYVFKGFHGQQLTCIKDIGVMRHMRLAHLTIAPVKYNPIENKIVVYNNIEFEVVMENADMSKTRSEHESLWSPAFSWMESLVVVPEALRFGERNAVQSYLIVADPAFKDALAPFVAWKTQKGFKVQVVYADQFGTGAALTAGLKEYIHNLYNNPTADMPAPSYVLFVGDHDKIPAFKGQTNSHITDLYYAAVTPGDFLPDILTGRFSASDLSQLQPQIDKTLEYEKFQFADPSFLDDVVLVAGWDGSWARSHGWPHINYAKKYYINEEKGFRNVATYLSAGSHQNEAKIVADVAKGACYVNYTAHGSPTSWADPSFSISNIMNLGNKGKYPFVIGNCCITNKFELAQCFGEAWLRAKDAGAIGYVGGSNNTYWDEDFWWGVGLHAIVKPNNDGVPPLKEKTGPGAFEALFEGNGTSNAGFMMAGNLAVEQSNSSRKQYYWEIYHLMGDPALKTFMGQPKAMRVSFDNEINARTTSVKVNAPAGSYVGISANDTLLGAAFVDADGSVDVNLSSVPANGEAMVVVTAANAIPFMGKINIR